MQPARWKIRLPPIIENPEDPPIQQLDPSPGGHCLSDRLISLPDAEQAQDDKHNHDQTDYIDDVVQSVLLPVYDSRRHRRGARLTSSKLDRPVPWIRALAHIRITL